jgi:5-(carboxyamino)imidazole ribonucleotide synthase
VHAQDKLVMRHRLAELGLRVPPFREVRGVADVVAFAAEHGWPVVLKTSRGGYDGRGTWLIADPDQATELLPGILDGPAPLLVEQHVHMRRELAVQVARSPFGQAAVWPVVQTVQRDGICVQVVAPAPDLPAATAFAAQRLALRIAAELDVVGLLAVELFDAADGLVVNELAMRPHNSGHWTIEGATTSQFEQHLRAVLDYPLGPTTPSAPVAVMSNVLGAAVGPVLGLDERVHHALARFPDLKLHLYGKAERPGRKIGHVTVLGSEPAVLRRRADLAAGWLASARWADGWSVHPPRET